MRKPENKQLYQTITALNRQVRTHADVAARAPSPRRRALLSAWAKATPPTSDLWMTQQQQCQRNNLGRAGARRPPAGLAAGRDRGMASVGVGPTASSDLVKLSWNSGILLRHPLGRQQC